MEEWGWSWWWRWATTTFPVFVQSRRIPGVTNSADDGPCASLSVTRSPPFTHPILLKDPIKISTLLKPANRIPPARNFHCHLHSASFTCVLITPSPRMHFYKVYIFIYIQIKQIMECVKYMVVVLVVVAAFVYIYTSLQITNKQFKISSNSNTYTSQHPKIEKLKQKKKFTKHKTHKKTSYK